MTSSHEKFMKQALNLASIAASIGEIPVGTVIVLENKIIGIGHNRRELLNSCLEHAEINAIKNACDKIGNWRLENCTVYSTLEPCIMCAGALLHARIACLVYGAFDPKFGAIESLYSLACDKRQNHQFLTIGGVLAEDSLRLLRFFFNQLRKRKKQRINNSKLP
jgi:tRNA(adenine34) deaminase